MSTIDKAELTTSLTEAQIDAMLTEAKHLGDREDLAAQCVRNALHRMTPMERDEALAVLRS
jgi:deoxyribose-phosphate aldolase